MIVIKIVICRDEYMKVKAQLKDIVSFKKGTQINGDKLIVNGKYDYLNGGILPSGKWNEYNTEAETITISEGGNSCGFVNFMDKPFWCGAHCYSLFDPKVNTKYLYYALKSQQDRLMKIRSGACMPNIKKNDLGNFEIVYDTDSNKQFIAINGLDRVASMIAVRQKQLQKLDELVKSRFIELFGTIHDNRFGFSVVTLQDVSAPIKDGTHQTPTYTTDVENGYKFLSSKDVTAGKVDWSHLKYIPEELHRELYARISPRKGDILLAKNGTTGIAAIVDRDEVFDIYVSLALIRPLGVEPTYLWAAINAAETKQQFDASLKGIGVPNLHLGEIKKARIILPPMELQEQFAAFVEQTDKSKVAVQKALDEAQLLFDSLMQKYFG